MERDPVGAQDCIRRTFAACRRAMETELAIGDVRKPPCLPAGFEAAAEAAGDEGAALLADQQRATARNGASPPGAQGGPQNGAAPKADDAELVPASKSQLSYVRRLASSIGRAAARRVEVLVERSYGKPHGEL